MHDREGFLKTRYKKHQLQKKVDEHIKIKKFYLLKILIRMKRQATKQEKHLPHMNIKILAFYIIKRKKNNFARKMGKRLEQELDKRGNLNP